MKTTYAIWYMRPEWFRDGILGARTSDLNRTHIHLKDVELEHKADDTLCERLERIFYMMQGEFWSPNGEAWGLIRSKGLEHTSMSVGDCVVVDSKTYVVATFGFEEVK